MSEQALISVLMAVYNGERFIAEALRSVFLQPYAPMEIIVIDDGSLDRTVEVVRSVALQARKPIHYFYQPNQGQAAALNYALRLAKGDLIGFLDADDLWAPNRLDRQSALLVQRDNKDGGKAWIVLGRVECFVDDAEVNPFELEAFNRRPYHYNLSCSLFHRMAFEKVGGFDESMRMSCDWDWFVRAKEAGVPIAISSNLTLFQRIHLQNITRQREAGAHYSAQMIHNMLNRRRARDKG
jgi:glycosyltransferase involved in cell wall biosynthesis